MSKKNAFEPNAIGTTIASGIWSILEKKRKAVWQFYS
jgi:hypothetical protein